MEDRRKVSVTLADDGSLPGRTVHFDIRLYEDESALANPESVLANPELAKWLIQAALLPTDRENRKSHTIIEIFFSFYPMILEVSFPSHIFFSTDLTYLLLLVGTQYVRLGSQLPKGCRLLSDMDG